MKLCVSASALATLAVLAQVTLANFDIYRVNAVQKPLIIGSPQTDYGYQIFANDPGCAEVNFTPWYGAKSDVSGKTTGVRCKGDGCNNNNDPGNVDELEMHFSNKPLFHWTIYKNRNPKYQLIGLDGNVYGDCIVFPGYTYQCKVTTGRTDYGFRKFRCLTRYTVDEIHGASAKIAATGNETASAVAVARTFAA